MQVVVYMHENRHVGLCVDQIIDVVHDHTQVQPTATRPCVLGTTIIKDKVTELLDVAGIVQSSLFQSGFERKAA